MDDQLADCREVFCYFDSRGDEKISVQQNVTRKGSCGRVASDVRRDPTRVPQRSPAINDESTRKPQLGCTRDCEETCSTSIPSEIGRCCAAYEKEARLSFEDFVPIFQSISKNREKHTVEEFVEGLSHFDKEGNGLINVAELRHLLTTLGERLSDEEVDQLLAGHNDSHGNVNIADFVRNVMNS
ncbi:Myosin-2 essential light chain [Parelaphostrongylus tenuis]|uniref:Myosin-2 essential light chain n=1 Tax=Parelaphostrongylus tenuis TaxID=148309 RepID=A0AAD5QUE1_PARTN|nr:Myosin-2 essential light chain [Parelaphostrongylus tenuis]